MRSDLKTLSSIMDHSTRVHRENARRLASAEPPLDPTEDECRHFFLPVRSGACGADGWFRCRRCGMVVER